MSNKLYLNCPRFWKKKKKNFFTGNPLLKVIIIRYYCEIFIFFWYKNIRRKYTIFFVRCIEMKCRKKTQTERKTTENNFMRMQTSYNIASFIKIQYNDAVPCIQWTRCMSICMKHTFACPIMSRSIYFIPFVLSP